MHPFIGILGIYLPAYGVFTFLGIIFASVVLLIRGRHTTVPGIDILFTALFALIGAGIGGKILYLITMLPTIIKNFSLIVSNSILFEAIVIQGSVFYGGLIGAFLVALIYIRYSKLKPAVCGNLFAPAIPAFHAFARLGCLMVGCCYGIPHEGGIVFHDALGGAPSGIPLFPTQIIEAGYNIFILIALLVIERFQKRRGNLIWFYLLLYAPFRFALEFFRGDIIRGVWGGLSTSQWVSLALICVAIYFLVRKYHKSKPVTELPVKNLPQQ